MEAIRSPEVSPFLRKRIRQPRQAAHLHSDREVLPFHMGRANLGSVRLSHDGFW
jgi:hypothetical protein